MTVFYFLMLASLIYISIKLVKRMKMADALLLHTENALNLFIEQTGIILTDIEIEPANNAHLKKRPLNKTAVIAKDLQLGYDFIVSNLPANYFTELHYHKKANEFCYLVSGEVDAIVDTCRGRVRTTLKEKDWIYIRKTEPHIIESKKDSTLIIIAKPPVFNHTISVTRKILKRLFCVK